MPTRTTQKPTALSAPAAVAEPTVPAFDPGSVVPSQGETLTTRPGTTTRAAGSGDVTATHQPGYKGLKVWQRAMDLATGVYMLARTLPQEEQAVVGAELRQTAVRIPAFIAAGNSLFQRTEYVHSLSAAHGAIARLESTLLTAERLGLVHGKALTPLLTNASDVGRLLRGLIRALQPPPADDTSAAPTAGHTVDVATAG